jgi:alkylation response protein AidB-like acyl-CoA dehydrogenase
MRVGSIEGGVNLNFSPAEQAFRDEVATWLRAHVPADVPPPEAAERLAFEKAWQRTLYDHGWAGIAWPREYGGRGLSLVQQLIWFEEYALANAPVTMSFFVALNHGGPTLITLGTEQQKAFYLPKILRGETPWCQGFSEPNSGSDLASLKTRGVVEDDVIVVTGSKTWSTGAHQADYQELLIRTEPTSHRHAGLTWIICKMDLPGVEVRPIKAMDGEIHFCEVFYDNVRIPRANVVGQVNDGWKVAMTTLGFERGTASMGERIEIARIVEDLIVLARASVGSDGRPVIDDGDIAARLAMARAEAATLRAMSYLTISRALHDPVPGAEGVMSAVFATELVQRVHQLAVDICGVGLLDRGGPGNWSKRYLASRLRTIAGGTAQIRRNIIGERLLGLPRGR